MLCEVLAGSVHAATGETICQHRYVVVRGGAVFSALAPAAPHSILGPATSARAKNPMVRMAQ
jgi:hypothetical protein